MRLSVLIFAAVMLLGGCNQQRAGPQQESVPLGEQASTYPDYIPTRVPPPDFDSEGNRIFTAEQRSDHPVARYDQFPKAIAALMQQADIEQAWCKGFGDDPETFRACNRSEVLYYKLMRLGYCSGSEEPMAAAADDHWLECSKDPHYDPNRQIGQPFQFSEEEIAEVERSSAMDGGLVPGQRYVRVTVRAPAFDAEGNRIFLHEELNRQPAQLYFGYPVLIRRSMREADMERRLCMAGSGPDPEAMRACNRRNIIQKAIERFGFCDYYDVKSNLWRWRKCDATPEYVPRTAHAPPNRFSEREIAEAAEQAREIAARWETVQRKR